MVKIIFIKEFLFITYDYYYNINLMISLRDKDLKKYKIDKTTVNWKSYSELRNFTTGAS